MSKNLVQFPKGNEQALQVKAMQRPAPADREIRVTVRCSDPESLDRFAAAHGGYEGSKFKKVVAQLLLEAANEWDRATVFEGRRLQPGRALPGVHFSD